MKTCKERLRDYHQAKLAKLDEPGVTAKEFLRMARELREWNDWLESRKRRKRRKDWHEP